jgi:heat-inducible transcriptional repressor
MTEDRRLHVLRAIVQDYVATSEPVGSKALVERHQLGVSAATVRNDMAILEEEGLIHAPHTSAGRVPTDLGYRTFVDRLGEIKPLSTGERAAITEFLHGALDLDDIVDRTVRLLASLTRQVAVVQYPSLSRSTVRHIEVVPMGATRIMVVLIVNTGRVEQRVVDTGKDLTTDDGEHLIASLRARINDLASGVPFAAAATLLRPLADEFPDADRSVLEPIVSALEDALVEEREERVVLAGQANLTRSRVDFPRSIGPILEALEEHVVLLRLLGQLGDDPELVSVRIGHENPVSGLQSTSLVSMGYGTGAERIASLGVLGPTRMDYPTTMAAVRAVARYISEILGDERIT